MVACNSELADAGVSLAITGLDSICQLVDRAWEQQSDDEDATT